VTPTAAEYEAAALRTDAEGVELTLYVNGASDLSARAIANARLLCDSSPGGPFHLVLVDVAENLATLRANQILAVPTLARTRPLPVRKVVGDLSEPGRVLAALGLTPPTPVPAPRAEA
jgi:circadian clock protein KaiB